MLRRVYVDSKCGNAVTYVQSKVYQRQLEEVWDVDGALVAAAALGGVVERDGGKLLASPVATIGTASRSSMSALLMVPPPSSAVTATSTA